MLFLDYRAPIRPGGQNSRNPSGGECGIRPTLFAADVRTAVPCISSDGCLGGFWGLFGALVPQSQSVSCVASFPGIFATGQHPKAGVLLPSTLDDFSDSVLGDPITYAQCEQIPGSDDPMTLPVYQR